MKNLFPKKLPFIIVFLLTFLGSIDINAKREVNGVVLNGNYNIVNIMKPTFFKNAGLTDISLSQTANAATITNGSNIIFTLTVNNEGQNNVSGLVITDILPAGVTLVNAIPSVGTTSVSSNIITWQVGSVPAPIVSPITLTITATINSSGVFYNIAEITAMNETDIDSTPNNNNLNEDDISTACTSVPYKYCIGELIEIQASAPMGYSNYQWYKGGVPIVGANSANYTITSIGNYSFSADIPNNTTSCNGNLCCPIIVDNYQSIS